MRPFCFEVITDHFTILVDFFRGGGSTVPFSLIIWQEQKKTPELWKKKGVLVLNSGGVQRFYLVFS